MGDISARDLQDLQVLAATRRGGHVGRAAVRLDDLNGLLTLPDTLKSAKAAGDPVTAAEFDALVEDVHAMHRRLAAVVAALRTRRAR